MRLEVRDQTAVSSRIPFGPQSKTDLTNFSGQKSKEFYERGILSMPERWQQVVDNNGSYFIETQLYYSIEEIK